MIEKNLPDWLAQQGSYTPPTDRDSYLSRSLLSVTGVLARAKLQSGQDGRRSPMAWMKLLSTLFVVVLVSLSRTSGFLWLAGTVLLVRLCILPGSVLARAVKPVATAGGLTALLLLPHGILQGPLACVPMLARVCIAVGYVSLLANTTSWNRLTGSLRTFRVPDLFIFTLDLALKYIVLLGRAAQERLEALTLRSVGHNGDKSGSLSAVAGALFLRCQTMSREMYEAMECRGWCGDYQPAAGEGNRLTTALTGAGCLLLLFLFLRLEGKLPC